MYIVVTEKDAADVSEGIKMHHLLWFSKSSCVLTENLNSKKTNVSHTAIGIIVVRLEKMVLNERQGL